MLVRVAERHGALDAQAQLRPVAQQEEQQVQHDAEADHELERVLADAQRLGREEMCIRDRTETDAAADAPSTPPAVSPVENPER